MWIGSWSIPGYLTEWATGWPGLWRSALEERTGRAALWWEFVTNYPIKRESGESSFSNNSACCPLFYRRFTGDINLPAICCKGTSLELNTATQGVDMLENAWNHFLSQELDELWSTVALLDLTNPAGDKMINSSLVCSNHDTQENG